jgi:hypothetical protein
MSGRLTECKDNCAIYVKKIMPDSMRMASLAMSQIDRYCPVNR